MIEANSIMTQKGAISIIIGRTLVSQHYVLDPTILREELVNYKRVKRGKVNRIKIKKKVEALQVNDAYIVLTQKAMASYVKI